MTRLAFVVLALAALPGAAARAQATANTHHAYAQVLRVEPVYELRTVQAVAPECLRPGAARAPPGRAVGSCQPHAVQVRRLVAYDVEYSYKGEVYMSRLAQDPGTRLRVRVTVVPDDDRAPAAVAPPESR